MDQLFPEGHREVVQAELTIITGPTAVGKSAFAVQQALACDGEIVNADSQQVYRGCDIGTGQITEDAMQGVRHHLLSCVSPDQQCNAAQYIQHADAAIADIRVRGKHPIVVGGTGLYLKSLIWGLCEAAPRNDAVRAELEQLMQKRGSDVLHQQLMQSDPELALEMHPNHTSRIIRALEVFRLTGKSIRYWQEHHSKETPRYHAAWMGLECARAVLRERIAARIAQQFADGWVGEVEALLENYGPDIPALRAIGYRDIATCVQQKGNLDATKARIVLATHQYAKRQMTYLRGIPNIQWQVKGMAPSL